MEQSEIVSALREIHVLTSDIMALDDRSQRAKRSAKEMISGLLLKLEEDLGYPRRESGNLRDQRQ